MAQQCLQFRLRSGEDLLAGHERLQEMAMTWRSDSLALRIVYGVVIQFAFSRKLVVVTAEMPQEAFEHVDALVNLLSRNPFISRVSLSDVPGAQHDHVF